MSNAKALYAKMCVGRLSLKERISFVKRLSFLMTAGVSLSDSFSILQQQAKRPAHAKMLESMAQDVASGQLLWKSFARFPKAFDDFSVSVIKVGESTGALSLNLTYLAEELKKRHLLRRKIISACVYPALITVATFSIVAFLMLYLFPKIVPVFASLNATLPLSTRMVIGLSKFLPHWGPVLLAGSVTSVVLCIYLFKKFPRLHYFLDVLIVKLPGIGFAAKHYTLANTTRTLALLLKSGSSITDALVLTSQSTRNLAYKRELLLLSQSVARGERVSTAMQRSHKYFPYMLTRMIAIGERTGRLQESLHYSCEMYEHEVDEFTKNLSTVIEPALMVVMGLLVGFIAISIVTPLYSITQNLHA